MKQVKDKLINSIFIIGMILVFITGVWGIIYEYVIWDKTFSPEVIFTTTCILGYIGIALMILGYFLNKKKK